MEVTTHTKASDADSSFIEEEASRFKKTFVAARRKIKAIDLRQTIVDNPFAAIGIGLAAGAVLGLVRPKPEAGRITGALVSAAGLLAYRLIRDTAVVELGRYASNFLSNQDADYQK